MARASRAQLAEGVRRGRQDGVQGDAHQHHQEGRHQAADPVAPEAGQPDAGVLAELGHQQAGDQESRQDEEDVDPEEPAAGPREPPVEEEDQDDAERPDPVEGRDPPEVGLGGGRGVHGRPTRASRLRPNRLWRGPPQQFPRPDRSPPPSVARGRVSPGSAGALGGGRALPPPHQGPLDEEPAGDGDGEDDGQADQLVGPERPPGVALLHGQVHGKVDRYTV